MRSQPPTTTRRLLFVLSMATRFLRLPSIIITPKPQDTEVMVRERGPSCCFEFFADVPIYHSYPNVHISDIFTCTIYLCKGKPQKVMMTISGIRNMLI